MKRQSIMKKKNLFTTIIVTTLLCSTDLFAGGNDVFLSNPENVKETEILEKIQKEIFSDMDGTQTKTKLSEPSHTIKAVPGAKNGLRQQGKPIIPITIALAGGSSRQLNYRTDAKYINLIKHDQDMGTGESISIKIEDISSITVVSWKPVLKRLADTGNPETTGNDKIYYFPTGVDLSLKNGIKYSGELENPYQLLVVEYTSSDGRSTGVLTGYYTKKTGSENTDLASSGKMEKSITPEEGTIVSIQFDTRPPVERSALLDTMDR